MRTVSLFFFLFRVVRWLGARGFSDQASHQRQQLGPGEGGAKMRGARVLFHFTGIKKKKKSIVYFKISIFFVVVVAYFTWR